MKALDRYRQDLIDRGYDKKIAQDMAVRMRYLWVMRARDGGMTFTAIGKKMGFSMTRARYMYHKALRMARYPDRTHLDRYCGEAPFKSKKEIEQAVRFFLDKG